LPQILRVDEVNDYVYLVRVAFHISCYDKRRAESLPRLVGGSYGVSANFSRRNHRQWCVASRANLHQSQGYDLRQPVAVHLIFRIAPDAREGENGDEFLRMGVPDSCEAPYRRPDRRNCEKNNQQDKR
jgi:hypothetical protein